MAKYTEWSEELEKALAEPFAPELHMQKGGKGTFVSVHHYVSRLNALVGVHGWSMEPVVTFHAGNKLGIAVGVTILGVTKWNVGDEMEDHGEPDDDGKVRDFGSSCTNSWAQAFKRCLAYGFRMGLYLYDKEWTRKFLAKGRPVEAMAEAAKQAKAPEPLPWHDEPEGAEEGGVPLCPRCGGQMWDNRKDKKNPKAPDFKCRDKTCLDERGFVTAIWADRAT